MIRYILTAILSLIFALVLPAKIQAQAPINTIAYEYFNETALNVNSNYVQTVTIDGLVITNAALKPTCVQAGPNVACTIPVGTLATGPHNISVSALLNNVTATTTVNNLNLGVGPKNPVNFKYQINITVNVP